MKDQSFSACSSAKIRKDAKCLQTRYIICICFPILSFFLSVHRTEWKKNAEGKGKTEDKGRRRRRKKTKAGSKKKCMWKKEYRRVSLRNAAFTASAFVSAFFRVVHQSKKAGKNANGRDQMTTQRQTLLSKRFYISIHIHRPPLHLYDLSARATRNKCPRCMDY